MSGDNQFSREPIDPLHEVRSWSAEDRIAYIDDDNHVVSFPEYERVNQRLQRLMHRSLKKDPEMLLVTGLTGMGKSTLLEQFAAEHVWYEKNRRSYLPVLYVTVPGAGTPSTIKQRMLMTMNAPARRKMTKAQLYDTVHWNLTKNQVQLVIVDEIQHIKGIVKDRDYRECLNFFKDITSHNKISVVLSGLRYACQNALNIDTQIKRRCKKPITLKGWRYSEELADFLEAYEQTLPLRNDSSLGDDSMVAAIASYCNGTTDHICETIRDAAIFELARGKESITLKTFTDMKLKPTPNLEFGDRS